MCAAANYDLTCEHKDADNDDNDYTWGGEGHCQDHLGSDDRRDSPEHWRNRLKTLPSMGDPAVVDGL